MNKTFTNTSGLTWVIDSRRDIQKTLLKLVDLGKRHEKRLVNHEKAEELGVLAALVGASFGLWRAAFLVSDSAEKPDLLRDSLTFLRYLLLNNTIGYMQDVATLDWSAAYYLNNAILRLNWIRASRRRASRPRQDVAVSYEINVHREKWKREFRRLSSNVDSLAAELDRSYSAASAAEDKSGQQPEQGHVTQLRNPGDSKGDPLQRSIDLKWLVEHRSAVLLEMVELFDFASQNQGFLKGNDGKKYVRWLALLIGAGYGLWRSAYLLSESKDRPELLANCIDFAIYLIRNNTIGYMQDLNAQDWAGGHYFTNATLRLNLVRPELGCGERIQPPSFKLVVRRPEWEHEFSRLKEATLQMKRQVNEKKGLPEDFLARQESEKTLVMPILNQT